MLAFRLVQQRRIIGWLDSNTWAPRTYGAHHMARVHGRIRSAHGPTQRTTSNDKATDVYRVYKVVSMVKGNNIIEHKNRHGTLLGMTIEIIEKHLDYHETTQDPNQI